MHGHRTTRETARAMQLSSLVSAAIFVWLGVAPKPLLLFGGTSATNQPPHFSSLGALFPLQGATRPGCTAEGKKEIAVTCDYEEASASSLADKDKPPIALNRSVIGFNTDEDNYLHVQLTFTNLGKKAPLNSQPVYLAIDDAAGHNYVRRVLPHVDFRRLAPGKRLTFSDRLLVGALHPAQYAIYLWIPDPDPSLKFDSAHNFLLSSSGVPDQQTGLNKLATFAVVR